MNAPYRYIVASFVCVMIYIYHLSRRLSVTYITKIDRPWHCALDERCAESAQFCRLMFSPLWLSQVPDPVSFNTRFTITVGFPRTL